ncbi:MAG: ATP-binding protein [Bacteroides sp.]|nr:ATP-binding protein [Bacteroides sp.]MCM1550498.1 ATP-binding protein [Clostridium sp.]
MRHSIQFKLTIVSLFFIALIIGGSWMLYRRGSFFWFEARAENNMESLYTQVNMLFSDSRWSEEELKLGFEGLNNPNNAIIVVSDGRGTVYTTTNEQGLMLDSLMSMTRLMKNPGYLAEEKPYIIEIHQDDRMDTGYYDLIGYLSNGYMIVIRTSRDAVNNSAIFTNRIFLYFSLSILFLAAIVIFCISRYFTKPIHDMAIVARRMSNLDFDARIQVNSKDEVGELGDSMNRLSTKLESAISELKTANNELQHDIENKNQIDEMRKEFLSHVSHELKTPIALIQGYAEGLKESIHDDPESREFYCDVIMDEANKMNNMVKKLLSLNELEFGSGQVQVSRFDIVELIRNICNTSDILLEEKNAVLEIQAEHPLYVWADEFLIEEAATNYLTNAMHYVSLQGKIIVRFIPLDKELQIVVFNTGSQIPEEEMQKLWIKFYKVDKARTREYGGSGIGLSIVAAAMEAHGKGYGVRNVPEGVEFYFNLDTDIS